MLFKHFIKQVTNRRRSIPENRLWRSWSVMTLPDAKLQVNEKNSFKHPPSCILRSFSQNTSHLPLPKRLWKFESTISFWKAESSVTCNLPFHPSQRSSCWVMAFNFSCGFSWVQFLSNKLELFVSCNNTVCTRKKQYQINLGKTCYMTNPFRHSKI